MPHKVRLNDEEMKAIITTAKEVFGESVRVWLFGSRTDLNQKGGDIDLYIETEEKEDLLRKKLKFLVSFEEKVGEQKVDVIIKPINSQDKISLMAKKRGVRLI